MGLFNINRLRVKTGRLLTESSHFINEADYIKGAMEGTTSFNEALMVKRTPVFNLSSIFPLSVFRDVVIGSVTNLNDGYQVAPGSKLESAQLGIYIPGFGANVGLGYRFNPADGCETDWGYFDSQNGFLFRYTPANGYQLGVRKAGVTNFIDRSSWNVDKLDGTGPSGVTLDMNKGYIFEIDFSWYGYGPVVWKIVPKSSMSTDKPKATVIHVESIQEGTSIENANLPISVDNFGTVGNVTVTGRQYSIIGDYVTESRSTGHTAQRTVGDTWEPVLSFRRKVGESLYTIKAEHLSIINSSVEPVEFQLLLGGTLADEVIVAPENRSAGETALEFAAGATSVSGGEMFYSEMVAGTARNGGDSEENSSISKEVPRDFWVTLVARTITPAASADLVAHLRAQEQW